MGKLLTMGVARVQPLHLAKIETMGRTRAEVLRAPRGEG